ncbi:MAG: tRNA (adenosine(37)-N6)-threonylcarbamoyltransferase complex ATPase subunit type 1 TsaE [Leptospiraceae bacterium]|nr:tRNA (adenosine(37)-N6)-threonylcarbamoyltransferase complex ATPase subunit type 1 TsaE [Leptospiraceae bacterium]
MKESAIEPIVADDLNEIETERLALSLVERCRVFPGAVWLMEGDLGAGKTTFVRFASQGLGIDDTVNSPTFNLCNQYEGRSGNLNHFDLYRLSPLSLDELEFAELWESLSDTFTINAIEWWTRLPSIHSRLPFVRIRLAANGEKRSIIAHFFEPGEMKP